MWWPFCLRLWSWTYMLWPLGNEMMGWQSWLYIRPGVKDLQNLVNIGTLAIMIGLAPICLETFTGKETTIPTRCVNKRTLIIKQPETLILERCYKRFNDEFTTPWIKKDLIYYIQNAIYSTIRTLTEYLTSTLDVTHYVTLYLNFESHDLKYQWPFVVASLSFACFWSLFHVFL